MPRLQRRSRLQRGGLEPGGVKWQRLIHGYAFCHSGDEDFRDDAEMMQVWTKHRVELLQQCDAGMRPAAYYRLDLKLATLPERWHAQLDVLLDHGLVSTEEAIRIEKIHSSLSPAGIDCGASFSDPEQIRKMHLDRVLENLAAEFRLAEKWHLWRGRPEIAEAFAQRAAAVAVVLGGEVHEAL